MFDVKIRLLYAFSIPMAVPLRQLEAARLTGCFRQQVLHLRVDTAQLVVGPLFQRLEQFCVKAEKESLLDIHDHKMRYWI
jgi:hypothetical protein